MPYKQYASYLQVERNKSMLSNFDIRVSFVFQSPLFKTGRILVFSDEALGKGGRRVKAAKSQPGQQVTDVVTEQDAIFIECKYGDRMTACIKCNSNAAEIRGCKKYNPSTWDLFERDHVLEDEEDEEEQEVVADEDEDEEEEEDVAPEQEVVADGDAANADVSEDDDSSSDSEHTPLPPKPSVTAAIGSTRAELKRIVFQLVRLELQPLHSRVDTLERMTLPRGKVPVHQSFAKTGKGKCKGCGLSVNPMTNKRIKPGLVPLDIMGSQDDHGADPRKRSSVDFAKLINRNRYCAPCAAKTNYTLFDCNNRNVVCMICRNQRGAAAGFICKDCDVERLRKEHATYKKPLHNAFTFLAKTVQGIKEVTTSVNMDPSNLHHGEYPVGTYGSIDFMVMIETDAGVKHMFAIEVMATKIEELPKHAHKFAKAREMIGATKTCVIAFDIKESGEYAHTLAQKIDVLRRWVIFAVRYAEHLPNMMNWWLFPTRNAYSFRESEHMMAFYKDPVKIVGPPVVPGGTDWEFASDVFAVSTDSTKNPFSYLKNVASVDVHEFMFKGSFPNYALYNFDKETNPAAALRCTKVGCKECATFYG